MTRALAAPELGRHGAVLSSMFHTAQRDLSETLLQIGRRLRELRPKIPRGQWLAWLRTLPFARRSAGNYMALARWAQLRPADFLRFKDLGPSKLYALVRAPAKVLRGLRGDRLHAIPGTTERRSLREMSVPQFHALVAELAGIPRPRPSIERLVAGYRQRLRHLGRVTTMLSARATELEGVVLVELRKTLRGIAKQLSRVSARGAAALT